MPAPLFYAIVAALCVLQSGLIFILIALWNAKTVGGITFWRVGRIGGSIYRSVR